MGEQAGLLSDREVQQFLVDGYVLVRADFPFPLHEQIYRKLDEVFEKEGNAGNNILPRVPEIAQVFEHPGVQGALTSLLGPDPIMNPHRHCHLNPPGSKGQSWHKDCYVYDHNIRHPRFRWLLALYYPQDVDETMGPTGLLPRMHPYARVSDPDPTKCREEARPLCGPAGTVALVHFDAWHRATPNISDRKRYMLKFQFARMHEPREPSWDHRSDAWEVPVEDSLRAPCLDVWNWLQGKQDPEAGAAEPEQNGRLLTALQEGDDAERLRAAYALGAQGAGAGLLDELRREAREAEPGIEAKTPDNAHGTNPTACPAADGLIAAGPAAVPHLIEALEDEHWLVRASAADALGWMGPAAAPAAGALAARLKDEHWWVRRNTVEALGRADGAGAPIAGQLVPLLSDPDRRVRRVAALALAQLGAPAEGAVSALRRVLQDEDRYNRFYAALALRRLPDADAREALLDALFTARWCPITTRETMY